MDDSIVLILPKINLTLFDQVVRLEIENTKKEKAKSKFVNDTDTGIIYRRGWQYSRWERNHGDYDADIHFTEANGDYFQYSFTGSGIEYISNKSIDQGIFQVYIDNVLQGSYNAFSKDYKAQQILFSITNLPLKKHTLKVVKTSGVFISLDALKIYF